MSNVNNFRSTIINGSFAVKNLYDFYDASDNPAVGATLVSAGNIDATATGAGSITCNVIKTNTFQSKDASGVASIFTLGDVGKNNTFNLGYTTNFTNLKVGPLLVSCGPANTRVTGGEYRYAINNIDKLTITPTQTTLDNTSIQINGSNISFTSSVPTCLLLPTNSNDLCNKLYVDSRTNVISSTVGGYFTITGECSDISATKMYNWSFGGNRQGSSALVMDVALGCNCSLQYIYVSITGPITQATTFQLIKNGSATSSYNLTLPVNANDQTKIIDLSANPILFNRGDKFRWKTTSGNMVLDVTNNAGRMTMTFASSIYYSQEFIDLKNNYESFRDTLVPSTYATIENLNITDGVVTSLNTHINEYTDAQLLQSIINISSLEEISNNLQSDINTTNSNLSSTNDNVNNLSASVNDLSEVVTSLNQVVLNVALDLTNNLNNYTESNNTIVNDISYNLSLISSGSSGASTDFANYKTSNDTKVNDISNNLFALKTSHTDLSSNYYSYKKSNNTDITNLQQKTAGFTYSSANTKTTFAKDIQVNTIFTPINDIMANLNNVVSNLKNNTSFLIFIEEGYKIYCPVGIMDKPNEGYDLTVNGTSLFKDRVDISNAVLGFTQSTNNGIEWKTNNNILNSSISDNGSLVATTNNRMLFSIGGINKLDISNDLVTVNGNFKVTGTCNIAGGFTTDEIQASTQKLTNVSYITGSGHKFASPISINTDAISGYQLVVNGKTQLQGQVDISNGMMVFNQSANGIQWKNNNVVNTSIIDDGTNCHFDTKNKFYFDINGVGIFDISNSGITLNKNLYLPTGTNGQIIWGQSYSKIYDNGDLHIQTDDRMYIDIGTTNPSNIIKITPDDVNIYKPINVSGNVTTTGNIISTGNITVGGRIGINKTNPSYALDVNGDINISNLTSKILFNSGGSSIYDDLQLHIKTDDNMYFDIGDNNIIYVNGSSVNINKPTTITGATTLSSDLTIGRNLTVQDVAYLKNGLAVKENCFLNTNQISIVSGSIRNSFFYSENSANGVYSNVFYCMTNPFYNRPITVNIPLMAYFVLNAYYIQSTQFSFKLTNVSAKIYKNGSLWATPNVNATYNFEHTGAINFENVNAGEYISMASITFTPDVTNRIDTYELYFAPSYTFAITYSLNTVLTDYTVSVSFNNQTDTTRVYYEYKNNENTFPKYFFFNYVNPGGFSNSNYVESKPPTTGTVYMNELYVNRIHYGIATDDVQTNATIANETSITENILDNFNYNINGGGNIFNYTFPNKGLYLVTCGDNYEDNNLIDVFYIYAGISNYSSIPNAIFNSSLSTVTQTDNYSFSIIINTDSSYNNFKISYQKIN